MACCTILDSARNIGFLVAGGFGGVDTTAVAGTVTDFDFFPAGGLNVRVATGKVLDEDFLAAAGAVLLFDKPEASLGFLEGGGGAEVELFAAALFSFLAALWASERAL
jgi:hypothetical protein